MNRVKKGIINRVKTVFTKTYVKTDICVQEEEPVDYNLGKCFSKVHLCKDNFVKINKEPKMVVEEELSEKPISDRIEYEEEIVELGKYSVRRVFLGSYIFNLSRSDRDLINSIKGILTQELVSVKLRHQGKNTIYYKENTLRYVFTLYVDKTYTKTILCKPKLINTHHRAECRVSMVCAVV